MDRADDSGVLSNSCPLRGRYFQVQCPKLKFHFWPLQPQIPQPGPHSNPSQCSSALTWSLSFTILDRLERWPFLTAVVLAHGQPVAVGVGSPFYTAAGICHECLVHMSCLSLLMCVNT